MRVDVSDREKAEIYENIKILMGCVQNGSDTAITLFQDDATYTYHVTIRQGKKTYWGNSLGEAINKAIKDSPPNP